MAGVPKRMPEVTNGFSGSLGIAFLLPVMRASPNAFSACPGRCKSEPPYRPNSEPGMEAAGESLRAVDEFSLEG